MYGREKILPYERTKRSRDWMQTVPSTKREENSARYGVRNSHIPIDPIHKWRLFSFYSVIVQISLPSLTLEQEFFSV